MPVRGIGPTPARLMFVGERPGDEELRQGIPFVGRSSVDFIAALNGYDLPHKEDVFLTNLIRHALLGKKITKEEIERDAPILEAELQAVTPEIIVTLGAHAAQYFLGDVDLEMVHAQAHRIATDVYPCGAANARVFALYHPAAGIHSPELGARYDYGMQRLGLFLKGALPPAVRDEAGEIYIDASPGDVEELFARKPEKLGIDTEGWTYAPWSIQASDFAGFALVMRTPEAIAAFVRHYHAADPKPLLIFHPALHELPMLATMGITVPDDGFTDTSLKAHLLGIEPIGAKPLFYRHAGMTQDSYDEITHEAGERMAFDFLYEIATTFPREAEPAKGRRKKGEPPKPPKTPIHPLEKALRLIDRSLAKEDEDGSGKSLRARWKDSRAREVLQDELELIGDMPEPTLDDVPLARAIRYAGRDADGTLRIDDPLDAQINAMGLRGALNADIEAVPMLNRMQVVGFGVEVDFFRALAKELTAEWAVEQRVLDAIAGHPLNVNSTLAVPEYLFDELGLPIRKFTDGGNGSTNDKILEAMRLDPQTPSQAKLAIHQIQEVREIRKIKSGFAEAIPQFVRLGRIHPRFRIVGTGRLACSNPNLLAFPKHSTRGLRIREGFVAGANRLLASIDLSQIEMRVFTIDCDDERMLAQFRSGYDFHLMGAAERLGKKPADVTKHERFTQKAINFGVLMGITEHGLLDQYHKAGLTNFTLDDMRRFLAEWFRQYPGARTYISQKHAEARRCGYVKDMWGRLRYIPGIRSGDRYVREAAERQAQATPTQSGAQGLMKRYMAHVWRRMVDQQIHEGYYWEPILQIHDDLITEFDGSRKMEVEALLIDALDELQQFKIPIAAGEPTFGRKWSEI